MNKVLNVFRGGSFATTLLMQNNDKKFVRKYASSPYKSKLKDQFNWLSEKQSSNFVPKVYSSQESDMSYSYDLEFLEDGEPLKKYLEDHPENNSKTMEEIIKLIEFKVFFPKEISASSISVESYYKDKIFRKLNLISEQGSVWKQWVEEDHWIINGTHMLGLKRSLQKLISHTLFKPQLLKIPQGQIHGDISVDNVLMVNGKIVFIDPNNENWLSDLTVEYGKLLQSLNGLYEILDDAKIKVLNQNELEFQLPISSTFSHCNITLQNLILRSTNDHFLIWCKWHEVIHFVRLLPYKLDNSPEHFSKYFFRTVELANQLLKFIEAK